MTTWVRSKESIFVISRIFFCKTLMKIWKKFARRENPKSTNFCAKCVFVGTLQHAYDWLLAESAVWNAQMFKTRTVQLYLARKNALLITVKNSLAPPLFAPPQKKNTTHFAMKKNTLWRVMACYCPTDALSPPLFPPPLFPPLLMYTSLWLLRSLGAWTKSATKKVEKCQGCLASWAIIADQLIQARAACCRSAVL